MSKFPDVHYNRWGVIYILFHLQHKSQMVTIISHLAYDKKSTHKKPQ